jgi:hypothetical protein
MSSRQVPALARLATGLRGFDLRVAAIPRAADGVEFLSGSLTTAHGRPDLGPRRLAAAHDLDALVAQIVRLAYAHACVESPR